MKKVIIAGGRTFGYYPLVDQTLKELIEKEGNIIIVTGGAKGADSLGKVFSRVNKLQHVEFPANWDGFGKSAGFIRNKLMAEYADMLVAFWDGESKGTKHMIDLAKEYNLKTIIRLYGQN